MPVFTLSKNSFLSNMECILPLLQCIVSSTRDTTFSSFCGKRQGCSSISDRIALDAVERQWTKTVFSDVLETAAWS